MHYTKKKGVKLMLKWLCIHDYAFIKNLYGYACWANGYKRSLWTCTKCGKRKFKSKIVRDTKN